MFLPCRTRPQTARRTTIQILEGPLATYTAAGRLKAITAGSIGNLVEWYDWYAYSAAALYFAPVFFPEGDQTAQLLQAAAIFAVGFFARPVGAWIMGRYSDRFGRKKAMILTLLLMALGSIASSLICGNSGRMMNRSCAHSETGRS